MKSYKSLVEVQHDIELGEITCLSLLENYLEKISEKSHLNIFLETFDDSARRKAEEVDRKIASGNAGKLAGMIIGIKDNICYKGHKVSAGSKMLENFESLYSSTVVERLLEEDAIIIGRLNCDEFAMGSSNENSAFGPVKNPLDNNLVPGGSSGGSAAAVAAGLCLATLGSDTGGSIRQPSAFCGSVGIKPTYGRVSRHGLIAFASSLDQIGPITNSVEDAAKILEVISGVDEYDETASNTKKPVFDDFMQLTKRGSKKKIAFINNYIISEGIDPIIQKGIKSLMEKLKLEGHQLMEIEFPYEEFLVPIYYILSTAEASSNLARYDGIHFGYRSPNAHDLNSTYLLSRSEGFGKEVKRRIMLGTYVLSSGYYDAYYSKAQKARRKIKNWTDAMFENCDFILSPTTPHFAFPLGAKKNDPIKMYLEDIYTVHANLTGNPAISLPFFDTTNKLPYGIQLMAPSFEETELLAFSSRIMNNFPG